MRAAWLFLLLTPLSAQRYDLAIRNGRVIDPESGLDAVKIMTPDHLHAVGSMAAIKLGKHVHCQKPLTHSVFEARALGRAAAAGGIAAGVGSEVPRRRKAVAFRSKKSFS